MNLIFILVTCAISVLLYFILPPIQEAPVLNLLKGGPLEINNTLFLMLPVFLISLYILNKLLFSNLVNVWDRRQKLTKGTIEESNRLNEEVENIIKNYDLKMEEAREEANEIRNELRKQGQEEADNILTSARSEAQSKLDDHRNKLTDEIQEIKTRIQSEVDSLSRDISDQILDKGA